MCIINATITGLALLELLSVILPFNAKKINLLLIVVFVHLTDRFIIQMKLDVRNVLLKLPSSTKRLENVQFVQLTQPGRLSQKNVFIIVKKENIMMNHYKNVYKEKDLVKTQGKVQEKDLV